MRTIKSSAKYVFFAILAIGFVGGAWWYLQQPKAVTPSQTFGQVVIPDAENPSYTQATVKLETPSTKVTTNGGTKVIHQQAAWQAQNGWIYANGGPLTTKGSIFDKNGLEVTLKYQDSFGQTVADYCTWVEQYKANPNLPGFTFSLMGTGVMYQLQNIYKTTEKLGAAYQPVVFYSAGASVGEDQVMGYTPTLEPGCVIVGVRLDGDLDLAIKYSNDKGQPVNVDERYYDPNATNLMYTSGTDQNEAVTKFLSGYSEPRQIIIDGKTTGRDTTITATHAAVWTPADVNLFEGSSQTIYTVISTGDYRSMMPNITIGCKQWLNSNSEAVDKLIVSLATAGDQIRSFKDVSDYACSLNVKFYGGGKNAKFWQDYYKGVQVNKNVHLGGSQVYNLADVVHLFGINGGQDIYKAVYTTFGDLQSKYYPVDLPTYVPYEKAVDKKFIFAAVSNHPELLEGQPFQVQYAEKIEEVKASKNYNSDNPSGSIQFDFGKATINPNSYPVLDLIFKDALVSDGLKIGVYGHTDNVGDPESNYNLSVLRAEEVKRYLIKKGVPAVRIESDGFGETRPVNTEANQNLKSEQARNRRVEIVLGR